MSLDFSEQYNTPLSNAQEGEFQQWLRANGRQEDLRDYDMRGAWQAGDAKANGHLPDTYKKPNHPTFSNESKYHTENTPGGSWVDVGGGKWEFKASKHNVKVHGEENLKRYFEEVEPGNTLTLPSQ